MSKRPISVGLAYKDTTTEALTSPTAIQPTAPRTIRKRPGLAILPKENSNSSGTPVTAVADSTDNGNENALAPITQRSPTRRVVPKKSRLAGILAPKPSISQFASSDNTTATTSTAKPSQKTAKENSNSRPKSSVAKPTISSDAKKLPAVESDREHRPRGRLTGSASRLGGLGNIVRHASKGLLKDVTNNTSRKEEQQAEEKFVDVGVEDVEQEAEEDADRTIVDIHGHAIMQLEHDNDDVALSPADQDIREFARNDPDIEEIVVIKRQKDRGSLDYNWAQAPEEGYVAQTDTDKSSRSKTGWWKRGSSRGRKSSSSFLKELGEHPFQLV
jgi:hypothetical protein